MRTLFHLKKMNAHQISQFLNIHYTQVRRWLSLLSINAKKKYDSSNRFKLNKEFENIVKRSLKISLLINIILHQEV